MCDPVKLTQDLVRCPSVAPEDAGAFAVVEAALAPSGFSFQRQLFQQDGTPDVENLVATVGSGRKHLGFAGHVDVVPPGEGWTVPPYGGEIRDGLLYGRGAADMKSGVAAFAAAAVAFLADRGADFDGRISLILTGDEEGPAINGTQKMMAALRERNAVPDVCLLGEPTCPETFGDAMKIGRRGSLTAYLTVTGVQGHVAYPDRADNPVHRLVRILAELTEKPLDAGNADFPPSNLSVTTVDVGNPATNVIPAAAKAVLNIRYSTEQTAEGLTTWIRDVAARHASAVEVQFVHSADPFYTRPGPLSDLVAAAVADVTGIRPSFSTSGGTSDARFIKDYCPVVEFGLVGKTMHKVDEYASVADIHALTAVYRRVLERFFAS